MLEKLPDVVGHVLRGQRAGLEQTAFQRLPLRGGHGALQVRSLAFVDHGPIPPRYTADGEGLSPPLQWTGVPPGAGSLVLLVEDADSPTPHPLVHAIAVNLPAEDGALAEGALNRDLQDSPPELAMGRNSYLQADWLPPDPPPGHGPHRYVFQLFALGPQAALRGKPGRDAVLQALQDHALASGCLMGTYERHDTSVKTGEGAPAVQPLDPA